MLLNRKNKHIYFRKVKGFTLLEVLVALAIMAISLIPLLHLLVISISMVDSANCLSYASLIANDKLSETVSRGHLELGTESGIIDNGAGNVIYKWQVSITDVPLKELEKLNLSDLRKVNVCVLWNQGQTKKQVSVSSLISPEQAEIKTVSHDNIN
jgi:type II secretion system protein I